jgi:hypothetical protein
VSEDDAYARKEGFPTKIVMGILGAIVVVLWFVVGYGYFTNPLPASSEPPTIWLVYEDQLYSGIRGSYCWADKCVDTEFQEPTGIVDVMQGSSVELLTNGRTRPTFVNVQIFVIDSFGNPMQVRELGEENDKYKVDLEKGVYVLQLQANWQVLGDVNYAFKIKVN